MTVMDSFVSCQTAWSSEKHLKNRIKGFNDLGRFLGFTVKYATYWTNVGGGHIGHQRPHVQLESCSFW